MFFILLLQLHNKLAHLINFASGSGHLPSYQNAFGGVSFWHSYKTAQNITGEIFYCSITVLNCDNCRELLKINVTVL